MPMPIKGPAGQPLELVAPMARATCSSSFWSNAIRIQQFRSTVLAVIAILVVGTIRPLLGSVAPQIPSLRWEERSDWISVKTGITPAAVGDGQADDTVALQKALSEVRDGTVLYFPPGSYRITSTLVLKNPTGARWIGGLIVGSGRDTRLVWDGAEGRTMLLLNGMAYSRFVGFELDGRGKAGVGFHYQATQGFQTEVTHRHLAFRGFTNAAVLEDHPDEGQALAETTFENCLFEDCERGVAFLQFNDYDFTFDGCEFRRCGVAIDCNHGNFYVRNCHFEGSRVVDVRDGSEHCSSIRRSTSTGPQAFVSRSSSVAPLTIQDCRVDGWKNPEGAVLSSRPPLLLFDCEFTTPPKDAQGAGLPPVRVHSDGQRLLVSGNQAHGAPGLTQGARPMLMIIPAGERKGVVRSASQSFLRETARLPKRVFDARRDFGAQANGVADDTSAIQKTIAAASTASGGAMVYLPTGRYVITNTLRITGKDFFVGGSGWRTQLIWRGPEDGVMVEVRDAQNVVLEDLMVGAHDAGSMNNGADIHQVGSTRGSRVTYDGVYVFGMYQKQPRRKGFLFTGLGENDVVIMPHVQGNLRFVNCGRATVLANCSYEGSVVVEGKEKARDGLLGFQTRLATIVTHGLYLRNNHSIVMSDFYVEQADNGYLFEGAADDPPGRATLTGAKFHSFTSSDPAKNTLLDIRNYRGQISIGPYQFYQEPKRMRMKQQGAEPVELFVWASSWYGAKPDPQLGPTARLWAVGNEFYGTAPAGDLEMEGSFLQEAPTDSSLTKLSRALDDLRRLGEIDLRFNHPSNSK
ncbi:MAG TPA: glycosyl hydrolase family 28-related protein [Verrucomicrobiae bacterium]